MTTEIQHGPAVVRYFQRTDRFPKDWCNMMAAQKEWYTLQEIVEMTGFPYAKVRAAVYVLRNSGTITVRDNPIDSRVLEVHRDSLDAVKRGLGMG